jgi:hypothetical protein
VTDQHAHGIEKPLHVDTSTTWVKATRIGQVVLITAAVVAVYMRIDNAIADLQRTVNHDAAQRLEERENIVRSVNQVRDELRKVFVDTVLARQAQAWIELARALNKDKYPHMIWPDLPR